jgi:hypothetical protein
VRNHNPRICNIARNVRRYPLPRNVAPANMLCCCYCMASLTNEKPLTVDRPLLHLNARSGVDCRLERPLHAETLRARRTCRLAPQKASGSLMWKRCSRSSRKHNHANPCRVPPFPIRIQPSRGLIGNREFEAGSPGQNGRRSGRLSSAALSGRTGSRRQASDMKAKGTPPSDRASPTAQHHCHAGHGFRARPLVPKSRSAWAAI